MKDSEKERIQELLENLPDYRNVMEQEIDSNVQKEYFNISKALEFDTFMSKDVIAESQALFLKNESIQSKKKVLTLLAHSSTVRSYRIIERYLRNPDRELRDWALLALQECRTMLESVLLEENRGTISAGLGGSKNRLKFFLLISSTTEEPFTKNQIELINEEFDLVCQEHDCRIEANDSEKNYATMKILVPLDVAVGYVIVRASLGCFWIRTLSSTRSGIIETWAFSFILG